MDLIERIGPVLGIVALLGLAVLAFLVFQQSRDIRRLREWAGRAPERAKEAVEASLAAAETRGDAPAESEGEPRQRFRRLREAWQRLAGAAQPRLRELDRRSPVHPRYLAAGLIVALVGAAALTGGFGLLGADGDRLGRGGDGRTSRPDVAVLNGTQADGLATEVEAAVVKPAGYDARAVTNTSTSFAETVVMYAPGHEDQARALATAVRGELGETPTQEMSDEVVTRSAGAPLALVIGLDDSEFGAGG